MDPLTEVRRQLTSGCETLRRANPGLYRDLALYLQVLRELLPAAVEKALFHLATRCHPQRYCELPAERRSGLQERSADLVRHAGSLLTVEQLVRLAATIAEARQQDQRQWLAKLHADAAVQATAASPAGDAEPEGSVQLSLESPVALSWLQGPGDWPDSGDAGADAAAGPFSGHDQSDVTVLEDPGAGALLTGPVGTQDPGHQRQMPPWDSARLPAEPAALVTWLDGYERALARSLLDLSHALNAELLRAGLSRSLLPQTLLEAALHGQLEQLAAPANLLRVQLPVPDPRGGSLEAVAVLLRIADLELEHPRLRSCRSRLHRHRQEVRRMAEEHRRLRRRLQALEAERLWHQDNPRSPLP